MKKLFLLILFLIPTISLAQVTPDTLTNQSYYYQWRWKINQITNYLSELDSVITTGILRTPQIIIDSNEYITGDTISYKVMELVEPNTADNYGGRIGRIVLEFYVPQRVSNGHGSIFEFDVVSDTLNGVYMTFMEARVRGSFYNNGLYSGENETIFQRWSSGGGEWTGQVFGKGTYSNSYVAKITPAARWSGEQAEGFIPCELWSTNQAGQSRCRLEIEFYVSDIPRDIDTIGDSISTWYVKLINM